jgi:hypothetical protein
MVDAVRWIRLDSLIGCGSSLVVPTAVKVPPMVGNQPGVNLNYVTSALAFATRTIVKLTLYITDDS